jgi:hypothetical protein
MLTLTQKNRSQHESRKRQHLRHEIRKTSNAAVWKVKNVRFGIVGKPVPEHKNCAWVEMPEMIQIDQEDLGMAWDQKSDDPDGPVRLGLGNEAEVNEVTVLPTTLFEKVFSDA